jgi:hypothetical protein
MSKGRPSQSDRSDKLVLTQTGKGGLSELKEVLDDSKASYAYVRITYSNDKESQREKFVLIIWIGPGCKVMRKAKASLFISSLLCLEARR